MEFLGNISRYIGDDEVYEISIDSYHETFVHRKEGWSKEQIFTKKEELLEVCEGLVKFCNITEDVHSGYLNEYIIFSLIQSPISLKGPALRITKLPKVAYSFDQYEEWKAIDSKGREVIEEALKNKKGILCAGDFGSGKTTLFNVVINSLPASESLVVVESEPGLTLHRDRVTRLLPRGRDERHIPEALDAASRMLGDTIALNWMGSRWVAPYMDLLKNNARGIAVVGGISPENTIDRLVKQAVISSDGYNLEEAGRVISEVFNILIFQEKTDENRRVVTSVNEIRFEEGGLALNPLYQKPKS